MDAYHLDLQPVTVAGARWSGRLKVVEGLGLRPDEFCKIAETVFAGKNVFESLKAHRTD
jgi:hypothetical protein